MFNTLCTLVHRYNNYHMSDHIMHLWAFFKFLLIITEVLCVIVLKIKDINRNGKEVTLVQVFHNYYRPDPVDNPRCNATCRITYCHTCYYSDEVESLPGHCDTCPFYPELDQAADTKCFKRWGICTRRAIPQQVIRLICIVGLPVGWYMHNF